MAPTTKSIERRNFKALDRLALLRALESWPWSDVYQIRDPDKVLEFINRGILHGMDLAAPLKMITVKEGLLPLYLRPDTLALMAKRDSLGRRPSTRPSGIRSPPWSGTQGDVKPGQAVRVEELSNRSLGDC
jgi:hypothetical protein